MLAHSSEIVEPLVAARTAPLAIELSHVCKAYKVYDKNFGFLREVLTGRPCHREKPVLEEISLDIRRGEVVGIIGRNGAGKSTLLKLIAGTLVPTTGKVTVNGRISAILELGTGFNPAYSGRDNVIMSALMRGMTEAEVRRKFDVIVAFSGLEDVIDQPFHTYSSGMQARLAFAAAVSVDADVIIIDEALAAGDIRFTARSLRRIREICESGVTALFVSHTTYQVMQLCTRAIWIDNRRIRMDGAPIEVVRAYEYEMHEQIAQDEGRRAPAKAPRTSDNSAERSVEAFSTSPPRQGFAVAAQLIAAEGLPPFENPADGTTRSQQIATMAPADPTANEAWCAGSGPVECAPAGTKSGEQSSLAEHYRVLDVGFLNQAGLATRAFRFGDRLRMRIVYECVRAEPPQGPCCLAVTVYRTSDLEPVMYFDTSDFPSEDDPKHLPDPSFRRSGGRGVFDAVVDPVQLKAGEYSVSVAIGSKQSRAARGLHEFARSQSRLTILPNGFDEPSVFYPIVTWRNSSLAERP